MPELIDYSLDYYGRPDFFVDVYKGRNEELRAALEKIAAAGAEEREHNITKAKFINTRIRTQGGQTLAHVVCMGSANQETVELLILAGADFTLLDQTQRPPIHIAANCADPMLISTLLKIPGVAELAQTPDRHGRTALHALCMPGSSSSEKRTDVRLKMSLKLFLALYPNFAAQKQALLQPDIYGVSPIQYAMRFNYSYILLELIHLQLFTDEDLELIAPIPDWHPALEVDYWGRTPAQIAAFDGDYETLQRLMHAAPSLANNPTLGNSQFDNRNLFHFAVGGAGDAHAVMAVLADSRTNPLSVDNNGSTALHFAAFKGNKLVVATMLQYPVIRDHINARDKFGMTPLHAAAMRRGTARIDNDLLDTIELLVANGADLHAVNNNGHTPYEVAIQRGNLLAARQIEDLIRRQDEAQATPQRGCLWYFNNCAASVKEAFTARFGEAPEPTVTRLRNTQG